MLPSRHLPGVAEETTNNLIQDSRCSRRDSNQKRYHSRQLARFVSKEPIYRIKDVFLYVLSVCEPVSDKFTSRDRPVIMSSLKLLLCIIGGSGGRECGVGVQDGGVTL